MEEKNRIANVWYIENNQLKHSSKIITTINYNDMEISILKSEKYYSVQEFLIKDQNNEYWKLGIVPIKFRLFLEAKSENQRSKEYCDDITNAYKKINLKAFWERKISNKKYFNKCELEYIGRYYPDIYENAKESRRIFEENRDNEYERERLEKEQVQKEKVKVTNSIFQKTLDKMKYKIFIGEIVPIENFEFYKDDKYENGKTVQNSILYLATLYGIKIPTATKGFINNRLVSYNFRTGDFYFRETTNKKPSEKMHEYLNQIFLKVKEEYQKEFENKKKKTREIR